ncbi:Gfo/Idh/MocA family oxidoreductase [Nitratireductor sp. XY-223]|uniref:Gfo/Idh/MocA family protein n=1 Tax=Nitratireductor sp. XY-223 TaxID=2561926 RepID=UPI001FF06837|nr:Gfo/Idh/MocA family oxidoreductase [Nitratireductor sp. XY-223]
MMHSVAILGAGIGREHMLGYRALPELFTVQTVCDRELERAEQLAALAPGCGAVSGIDAVMDDRKIDIVDICLPPHLHGPVALMALAAGKHVICEKPVAGSVAEADELMAAAERAGLLFAPVFQYRYGRALYQLAGLQDRGLCGKPLVATLETHWNRGAEYYAVPWRGRWQSERGGAVLGHAIHIHDLVTRFFGPVTEVTSLLDTRVNDIETEDCAAIAMATDSGGLVTSSVTLGGATDSSRLRLIFDALTAESRRNPYAPGAEDWSFTARDPQRQDAVDAALAEIDAEIAGRPTGFAGMFLEVSNHLNGLPADLVTVEDGVRSIELVAAIYHAARSGERVSLPLDRSLQICADWVPEDEAE